MTISAISTRAPQIAVESSWDRFVNCSDYPLDGFATDPASPAGVAEQLLVDPVDAERIMVPERDRSGLELELRGRDPDVVHVAIDLPGKCLPVGFGDEQGAGGLVGDEEPERPLLLGVGDLL